MKLHSINFIIFYSFSSALFLSLLGVFCGVWSQKFDHMAAITNFIITPLTFLSGTFYSISKFFLWFSNSIFLKPERSGPKLLEYFLFFCADNEPNVLP